MSPESLAAFVEFCRANPRLPADSESVRRAFRAYEALDAYDEQERRREKLLGLADADR